MNTGKKLVTWLPLGRRNWGRGEQEQGKSYFTFYILLKLLNFVTSIARLKINSCDGKNKKVSVDIEIKCGILFSFYLLLYKVYL